MNRTQKKVISHTMRNDAVKIIQEEILGTKYVPGQRIREDKLSEDLGISRTPIREALVVLEQQGLVVQIPHRGTFVSTYQPEEIVDMLRVQAALEGLAASMAAKNRTDVQIKQLEELTNSAQAKLLKSFTPDLFYDYDRKFHRMLVELSGSATIIRILEMQFASIYLCRYYTIFANDRFRHTLEEHRTIIECVKQMDASGAEKAIHKHLKSVIQDFKNTAKEL